MLEWEVWLRYIEDMRNRIFEKFVLIGSSLTGGAVVALALASLLGIRPDTNITALIGAVLGCTLTVAAVRKAGAQSAESAE